MLCEEALMSCHVPRLNLCKAARLILQMGQQQSG